MTLASLSLEAILRWIFIASIKPGEIMKAIVAKNYFGGFSKVGMKNKFRSVRPITEIPVVMVMMKSILFFSVELMLSKADLYEDNF